MFARIDAHPGVAGITGAIDTAAHFAVLICIPCKNLVGVLGVYQDAGEIPKWQIATATGPTITPIMGHVQRLSGSYVDERGTLRVLRNNVDRRCRRNSAHLLPGLSCVM